MIDIHKLELLEKVANDVVNRNNELESREYGIDDVAQAIKSMEIILVAIGARHEPVFVDAMNPEGSPTTTRTELSRPEALFDK